MATLTGKTEFAKRIAALGLTLVELEKLVPYKLQTLREVSCGQKALSPQLDFIVKMLENEKAKHGEPNTNHV